MDCRGLAGNRKCREAGSGIIGPFDFDWPKPFGKGCSDFFAMPRSPDTGAVDATAAAIGVNALGNEIDVLRPVIDHVVAEDNFAEPGPVDLDARVAFVTLDGFGAAENFHSLAAIDDFGPHFGAAGINADRLTRHIGFEERCGHAIRRPWFLRTG